ASSAHSRRGGPRKRHWPGDPLCRSQRAQTGNRGGVTVGEIQLEHSVAAVSLAAIQIGRGKIGRCDERRCKAVEKNGRGAVREADPETLETVAPVVSWS